MDLAKIFAKSSQFQVTLSMGEVHVRPLTSSRIGALEKLARSDQATDADVTRMALKLAARHEADPNPHDWNSDDEATGDDIAELATAQDLEAVAERIVDKARYLYSGPDHKGEELSRSTDETNVAFLRRVLRTYQERQSRQFQRVFEESKQRELDRASEMAAQNARFMHHQMERANTIIRAAEAVPRVEEHLESLPRFEQRLERTERSTTKFNRWTIAVSSIAAIAAAWALAKSYQDDPKSEAAIKSLSIMEEQMKATSDELRALRGELKLLAPPKLSTPTPGAPAAAAPKKEP